jgi:RND family efflux transporter MFP subunit
MTNKNLKRYAPTLWIAVTVAVVAVAGIAGYVAKTRRSAAADETVSDRRIKTLRLDEARRGGEAITVSGTVEADSQVELRAQLGGQVTAVNVGLGDSVGAGQVLVRLAGADLSAQLDSAQAVLKAQQARLAEMRKGTRSETVGLKELELAKTSTDLSLANANAVNAMNDAFLKADDAVRKQTDAFFQNDDSDSPTLAFTASDSQAVSDVQSARAVARDELRRWQAELNALGTNPDQAAVSVAVTKGKAHVEALRPFLNRLADVLNYTVSLPAATVDGYKASLSVARQYLNAAASTLSAQDTAYASLNLNADRVRRELDLMKAGATTEQIDAQQAAVDQAAAAVRNMQAVIDKTVVRAPVSGRIAAVPVHVGDLVSGGSSLVTVVSSSGLKVKAFLSEGDLARVHDGMAVVIGDGLAGTVSRLAPNLDVKTRKAEVSIAVEAAGAERLAIGQLVDVRLPLVGGVGAAGWDLPLQAVVIHEDGSASVMIVTSESKLKAVPITLGEVNGERVFVTGDLPAGGVIAALAGDLEDGQSVIAD